MDRQTRKRREGPGAPLIPYTHRSHWGSRRGAQEFKARNQIAAEFESVLCWWPTELANYARMSEPETEKFKTTTCED
ncbi:hypothetical protein QTO34_001745 [Cnephaeus nilssonii]|uniref:Uncharacterized protein n=1 Tax=Cnephaeus nilssonii TaxID=3371016 RepID=A0AA40LMN3_CNENI|nr:hypothetical protein QTO34_001745 [Eptesicus nilssonii]